MVELIPSLIVVGRGALALPMGRPVIVK